MLSLRIYLTVGLSPTRVMRKLPTAGILAELDQILLTLPELELILGEI
jgi:hypothetical protein